MNQVTLTHTTAVAPVVTLIDGLPWAHTRDIADFFDRSHKAVLVAVKTALARAPEMHGHKIVPMVSDVEVGNGATREVDAYRLDRDAFSLIVMGFTGERAFRWKLSYIDAFNRMEAEIRRRDAPDMDDNGTLRRLLLAKMDKVDELVAVVAEKTTALVLVSAVVEEQRPMVEAYEAFLDDRGLCNLRTAARAIDAPSELFFDWIKDRRYVFRENGDLQPSAVMRKDGYMKLRAERDSVGKFRNQAMVTRSGLAWLRQRWAIGPGKVLALQAQIAERQGRLAV